MLGSAEGESVYQWTFGKGNSIIVLASLAVVDWKNIIELWENRVVLTVVASGQGYELVALFYVEFFCLQFQQPFYLYYSYIEDIFGWGFFA